MPSDIEDVIKDPRPLDDDDYALLKAYGLGPYNASLRKAENIVKDMAKRIEELCGMHTGLTAPLQVARYTKKSNPNTEDAKDEKIAEVVELGDKVSPNDITEGGIVHVLDI